MACPGLYRDSFTFIFLESKWEDKILRPEFLEFSLAFKFFMIFQGCYTCCNLFEMCHILWKKLQSQLILIINLFGNRSGEANLGRGSGRKLAKIGTMFFTLHQMKSRKGRQADHVTCME